MKTYMNSHYPQNPQAHTGPTTPAPLHSHGELVEEAAGSVYRLTELPDVPKLQCLVAAAGGHADVVVGEDDAGGIGAPLVAVPHQHARAHLATEEELLNEESA